MRIVLGNFGLDKCKHMQDTVQYNDVALRTLLAVELPAESVEKIIESVISKLAKGIRYILELFGALGVNNCSNLSKILMTVNVCL